jgi:hypothetical protein
MKSFLTLQQGSITYYLREYFNVRRTYVGWITRSSRFLTGYKIDCSSKSEGIIRESKCRMDIRRVSVGWTNVSGRRNLYDEKKLWLNLTLHVRWTSTAIYRGQWPWSHKVYLKRVGTTRIVKAEYYHTAICNRNGSSIERRCSRSDRCLQASTFTRAVRFEQRCIVYVPDSGQAGSRKGTISYCRKSTTRNSIVD